MLGLLLAVAVGAALVGPAFAALVTSPPALAIDPLHEVPLTIPVIRVKTFENLGERGCFSGPPLHRGPSLATGSLRYATDLQQQITGAVWRCLDGWSGDLALSIGLDSDGQIVHLVADTADGRMKRCVRAEVVASWPTNAPGPGMLNVSYFMPSAAPATR